MVSPDIEKRIIILRKASEIFFNPEGKQLTMDEIAAESGISKKTLYKYFPSKAYLLKKIITSIFTQEIAKQGKILNDKTLNLIIKIQELMKLYMETNANINPIFHRIANQTIPNFIENIQKNRNERFKKVLFSLLNEGQQLGYVRKNFNLSFVANSLFSILQKSFYPNPAFQDLKSLVPALISFCNIVFFGIATDYGRKKIKGLE